MDIDHIARSALAGLIGKHCCRKRVGRGRSLSLGFGRQVPHSKPKTADPFYGEWEIGTYSSPWRVVKAGSVICGSADLVDSIQELDQRLQTLDFGNITDIEQLSSLDIRINLDDEVSVDFISASTEDDEMFHVFGPDNLYIEFTSPNIWKVGKSNAPWI